MFYPALIQRWKWGGDCRSMVFECKKALHPQISVDDLRLSENQRVSIFPARDSILSPGTECIYIDCEFLVVVDLLASDCLSVHGDIGNST